jgi:hypothetical protein
MRRVVSTGRRSRALERPAARAMGGAANAGTSAGAPTGRTCGACGALLSSSTTAKGTPSRPLRGQPSGSVAVMAAPAVSWHAPDARPLGIVPTQSARHKASAVGAIPRRRTSGRIRGRNTGTLCPARGKDAAIGRARAMGGNRAATSREPIDAAGSSASRGDSSAVASGAPDLVPFSQPRLASSAAPAAIAPSEARCATERPSSTRSSTRRNSIAKRSRPASSR